MLNIIMQNTDPEDYVDRFVEQVDLSGYESVFKFPESLGNFVSTGVTAHDQFESTLDGDPVVLTYNNFTVNTGHVVTTTNRCKGLYLNILGDLTINGTLSMTARGAKAKGKYVGISKLVSAVCYNETNIFNNNFIVIPPTTSGIPVQPAPFYGTNGVNGTDGGCGSGGTGGRQTRVASGNGTALAGLGAAGSSFSGGPGGGGLNVWSLSAPTAAKSGEANGGKGGDSLAYNNDNSYPRYSGGGAGNPGGRVVTTGGLGGGSKGSDGTGGLLILFVKGDIIFGPTGAIVSHGSNGGAAIGGKWGSGGGGSGGGAIHILHRGIITDPTKVTATGGLGGIGKGSEGGSPGGKGGDGTVNIKKF